MEQKAWWTSTTIQGLIIEVIVVAVSLFKINILKDEIQTIVAAIFGIIGTIMVIVGRLNATQPLGWKK